MSGIAGAAAAGVVAGAEAAAGAAGAPESAAAALRQTELLASMDKFWRRAEADGVPVKNVVGDTLDVTVV